MTLSAYHASIPALTDMLTNMRNWLDLAAAQKPEAELMAARLAPDMHPLPRQYQMASDAAKGIGARLTGQEAPAMPDTEASFAELKARCDKTIAFLQSIDPAAYDSGLGKEVVMTFPNGSGLRFDGQTYLCGFGLPNFYFHATTAYAILRAQGVEIGKMHFLSHVAPYMFAPPAAQG